MTKLGYVPALDGLRGVAIALVCSLIAVLAIRVISHGDGSRQQAPTPFTRSPGNPILSPTARWEASAVQEPSVIYESGVWKMWYSAGWGSHGANQAMGYATCTGNPAIAANWKKYAGNPVLGQGAGGDSGYVSGTSVFKFGSIYYAYFYDANGGGNLKVSTSINGVAWHAPKTLLAAGKPSWVKRYASDVSVWRQGRTWRMIISISTSPQGGEPWQLAYAISSNATPDAGWKVRSGSMTSLRPVGVHTQGSVYGDLWMPAGKIDGRYQAWYHAGNGEYSDIYHASSADSITWRVTGVVLDADRGRYERQQIADPAIVTLKTQRGSAMTYMFYGGLDNRGPNGYIDVATYPGTPASLSRWRP